MEMAIIDSRNDGRNFAIKRGSTLITSEMEAVIICKSGHPDTSDSGLIIK
jgi:hypothetical protein